ncbi:hypothetical protein [Streptomyces cinereospinus]|uniref:Uncharacterized protein n=1 Tax=Streptomyces cinereospinus TaxID=285561 RepID=A0ABV5MY75_9ACTN
MSSLRATARDLCGAYDVVRTAPSAICRVAALPALAVGPPRPAGA